jgi:hypothetical protein
VGNRCLRANPSLTIIFGAAAKLLPAKVVVDFTLACNRSTDGLVSYSTGTLDYFLQQVIRTRSGGNYFSHSWVIICKFYWGYTDSKLEDMQ